MTTIRVGTRYSSYVHMMSYSESFETIRLCAMTLTSVRLRVSFHFTMSASLLRQAIHQECIY